MIAPGQGELHVHREPMSPELHIGMHEIVTNQLWDDDPPEVWKKAKPIRSSWPPARSVVEARSQRSVI